MGLAGINDVYSNEDSKVYTCYSASALAAGVAVVITDSTGDRTVPTAAATADNNPAGIVGVTLGAISAGGQGRILVRGYLNTGAAIGALGDGVVLTTGASGALEAANAIAERRVGVTIDGSEGLAWIDGTGF